MASSIAARSTLDDLQRLLDISQRFGETLRNTARVVCVLGLLACPDILGRLFDVTGWAVLNVFVVSDLEVLLSVCTDLLTEFLPTFLQITEFCQSVAGLFQVLAPFCAVPFRRSRTTIRRIVSIRSPRL